MLESPPWASALAAFMMRAPGDQPPRGVEVEIAIPSRPELFPFMLTLWLDGDSAASATFEQPNETGRYRISGAAEWEGRADNPIIEVMLETGSYLSTVDDPRMKSYRLLNARAY
jgi:hypothetical protein